MTTPFSFKVAYNSSTAAGEVKSAGIARTFVSGASDSISFFVASSCDCERAEITTVLAPATANAVAIPLPIPLLPPRSSTLEKKREGTRHDDTAAFGDAFHSLARINGIVDIAVMCLCKAIVRMAHK